MASNQKASVLARLTLHPFLFALYPVLAQFAANTDDLTLGDLPRPILAVLALTLFSLVVVRLVTRSWAKAGLATTVLVLFLFVLWGALLKFVLYGIGDRFDIKVRYLFLGYLLFVVLMLVWVATRRSDLAKATKVLNIVAAALVLMAAGQAVMNAEQLPSKPTQTPATEATRSHTQALPAPDQPRPDVYFIVLDGYLRADSLKAYYGYDNTPFLDAVRERGFFVAEQSHTSYTHTTLSLPACLSMQFLETIADEEGIDDIEKLPNGKLYRDNPVLDTFRGLGYSIVGFKSGFVFTNGGPECNKVFAYSKPWWEPTRFEIFLLDFTPLLRILRYAGIDFGHADWYRRIIYNLEHVPVAAEENPDQPHFVLAHIIAPHAPFVMRADGSLSEPPGVFSLSPDADISERPAEMGRLYVEQIQGLNKHVLAMIDRIDEVSKTPPVIAIVSDHGVDYLGNPGMENNIILLRMPGVPQDTLPQSLNLVHLFPTLFNHVFGMSVPLPPEPSR